MCFFFATVLKEVSSIGFDTRIESKLSILVWWQPYYNKTAERRSAVLSVCLCCLGQYRCPSLCSSHSFQLGIRTKAASQTHSGGQHFTNIQSVCVCGGVGPLLSAIWANGRSLCQHGSHWRKRAQGHSRKLRRQTEGAFADTGHSFSVKEPLRNTCAPTPLCPTSDILSESPCSAELQAANKRLCRLGTVRAGE